MAVSCVDRQAAIRITHHPPENAAPHVMRSRWPNTAARSLRIAFSIALQREAMRRDGMFSMRSGMA
jgi:hypothetical protein